MAKALTKKLVLTQMYNDPDNYRVKKALNVLDYPVGESLTKKQVEAAMENGINVEICKI